MGLQAGGGRAGDEKAGQRVGCHQVVCRGGTGRAAHLPDRRLQNRAGLLQGVHGLQEDRLQRRGRGELFLKKEGVPLAQLQCNLTVTCFAFSSVGPHRKEKLGLVSVMMYPICRKACVWRDDSGTPFSVP